MMALVARASRMAQLCGRSRNAGWIGLGANAPAGRPASNQARQRQRARALRIFIPDLINQCLRVTTTVQSLWREESSTISGNVISALDGTQPGRSEERRVGKEGR